VSAKSIIVGIAFNSRSRTGTEWEIGLTKPWIKYRMSIFMKYTLQSLKKQTNQEFAALIRYAEASEDLIRETLDQYEPLPNNIQFIPGKKNIEIQKTLSRGCENLYLVRLDCDDTFHKSFIQQLHDYKPKPGICALINQEGYVYDSLNHRIASVIKPSPPFFTWIYNAEEYFNGKRYNVGGTHGTVIQYPHEILTNKKKRNYMIVLHERNKINQKMLMLDTFEEKPTKVNAILENFI